jgi:uncharacterized protein (DUF342 family)
LTLNGREQRTRQATNVCHSPSSAQSISTTAPLQTLSPLTSTIIVSSLQENVQTTNTTESLPMSTTNTDQVEKQQLKNDLIQLKNELQKSKETIARLQKSEEQMRER